MKVLQGTLRCLSASADCLIAAWSSLPIPASEQGLVSHGEGELLRRELRHLQEAEIRAKLYFSVLQLLAREAAREGGGGGLGSMPSPSSLLAMVDKDAAKCGLPAVEVFIFLKFVFQRADFIPIVRPSVCSRLQMKMTCPAVAISTWLWSLSSKQPSRGCRSAWSSRWTGS